MLFLTPPVPEQSSANAEESGDAQNNDSNNGIIACWECVGVKICQLLTNGGLGSNKLGFL
jgi:hypothetical protein